MLMAAFIAVTAMAGTEKSLMRAEKFPAKAQIGQKLNLKQAPKELTRKVQFSKKARAPKKAATAADFAGDYTWDYLTTSDNFSTDLESLTTSEGSAHVIISESTTTEGGLTISGMFSNDLEATVGNDGEYDYFVISMGQTGGTSSYGDYVINGVFYYEGDDTYEAGFYDGDIYGYVLDDGSIYIEEWIYRVLSTGDYAGYYLTPLYVGGSTLTPAEPLKVTTFPEGVVATEYVMTYDSGSKSVNLAVDGSDVYIQGMSEYCPEACVKGTKDGNLVTFPAMQYMGEYADMTSYFFYNGETVFTYDPEKDTYTAKGQVFGVLGNQYYDGNYTNPVIAPVEEKAVMPANPAITALTNGNYGWYIDFNVPLQDVNGDPILGSKLTYIIYTDVEKEVAPLTFTPATHEMLTEELTEIPYGFTENWDFYDTQIYLNDLYSEDWNKIGIQSIYYGGGETNATEIQWYHIKDYAVNEYTFNFNEMDVPTSATGVTDGDITEPTTLTEGNVSLTISTSTTSTPNRYWATTAGPQLRVYGGTLTFDAPEGYVITGIEFNYGRWNAGNDADSGEIVDDATNKVATWTGSAQTVVVTIAANSQIDKISVTLEKAEKLVKLPEGLETEAWAFEGFYNEGTDGYDVFRATEVAFDGTDIYVKGMAYWFEDAWLKGTINEGIATFPSGQFVGEDEYGQEFMIGFDGTDFCDIQYAYDADAKKLTQVTPYILESQSKSGLNEEGELTFWGYWEVSYFHAGAPIAAETIEVPEGLVTETYSFNASCLEEGEEEWEEYNYQIEIGFDGNDVYFSGLSDNTASMWAKGTLSEDGKTVTIPASQYLGFISTLAGTFDYYLTAFNKDFEDIVLNYDAETNTFSTEQPVVLNGSMFVLYPYQTFTGVTITKVKDFATTPADPSIESYKIEGYRYPNISFNIPTVDVEGNGILGSKLYYTVWVLKDGEVQPFTVTAADYRDVTEDMVEIPYTYDDSWDIYRGGSTFYINPTDDAANWTNFGIQSIYYGGGERHESNIVWAFSENVTVGESLYATYVAPVDVDFTGAAVSAYAVTVNGKYAHLEPVTAVPAGTAVVVKAEAAGTYPVIITADAALGTENELVAATADVTADGTQYILADGTEGIGFYKATPGTTIAAGKGYIVKTSSVKAFYGFDSDDATGISGINAADENAVIYNVAGQRLGKAQKGINIINGKKVLK